MSDSVVWRRVSAAPGHEQPHQSDDHCEQRDSARCTAEHVRYRIGSHFLVPDDQHGQNVGSDQKAEDCQHYVACKEIYVISN
jgi:hypothetical protein